MVNAQYKAERTTNGSTPWRSSRSVTRLAKRTAHRSRLNAVPGNSIRWISRVVLAALLPCGIDGLGRGLEVRNGPGEAPAAAPHAPDRAHQRSEVPGRHPDDPKRGRAHPHRPVDPGDRHLLDVVPGQQR